MSNCSQCGQAIEKADSRCPHCKGLNSKIDDILAKEAAETERKSLKGQVKAILQAEDKKQALLLKVKEIISDITKEKVFTFFVMFVFIFAMTYIVV